MKAHPQGDAAKGDVGPEDAGGPAVHLRPPPWIVGVQNDEEGRPGGVHLEVQTFGTVGEPADLRRPLRRLRAILEVHRFHRQGRPIEAPLPQEPRESPHGLDLPGDGEGLLAEEGPGARLHPEGPDAARLGGNEDPADVQKREQFPRSLRPAEEEVAEVPFRAESVGQGGASLGMEDRSGAQVFEVRKEVQVGGQQGGVGSGARGSPDPRRRGKEGLFPGHRGKGPLRGRGRREGGEAKAREGLGQESASQGEGSEKEGRPLRGPAARQQQDAEEEEQHQSR